MLIQNCSNSINRSYAKITIEEFKELLKLSADNILMKNGRKNDFKIDLNNSNAILNMFMYLSGESALKLKNGDIFKFEGDFNKGIMLVGINGTGKTLLMRAYLNIVNNVTRKKVTEVHAKRVATFLHENGHDYLDKRPLFVDDLGKEPKLVNDFGTKSTPLADLYSIRYDYPVWDFATTNYNLDTLRDFYGVTVYERLVEKFNIFKLYGKSRRPGV